MIVSEPVLSLLPWSIIDDSRSIIDDSRSVVDNSKRVFYNSKSVIDYCKSINGTSSHQNDDRK